MITHDHKLIFIHIPKCAGRSICDIFNQRFDHFTNAYYEEEFRYSAYHKYKKFTIVRNPYDRLVSIYHYVKQHRRHINEPISGRFEPGGGTRVGMPDFKVWVIKNLEKYKNPFSMKSPEGERGRDGELGSPFWFSPQFRRIMYMDHVTDVPTDIRVFKMEDELDSLEVWLAKNGVECTIPHENKSEHGDYRSYYDEALLEYLSNKESITTDCKMFNYTF